MNEVQPNEIEIKEWAGLPPDTEFLGGREFKFNYAIVNRTMEYRPLRMVQKEGHRPAPRAGNRWIWEKINDSKS